MTIKRCRLCRLGVDAVAAQARRELRTVPEVQVLQVAWVCVLDGHEGGLPSARYLGVLA